MNNPELYPLSHPQEGIWYTEKLYPGSGIGNIAATLKITGDIDYTLLEKAINLMIEKNNVFGTRIVEVDGEPKQYIADYSYCRFDFFDFEDKGINALYEWDSKQAQAPFELIDSKLYYIALLRIDKNNTGIFYKIHHTISDAWSIAIARNEIMKYYSKLKNIEEIEPDQFPSYIDYVIAENEYTNSERFVKDKQFWNEIFKDIPEIASFKLKMTNSISIKAKRKTFILPGKLSNKIRTFCTDNRTSMLTLFASALTLYINRVADRDDIVIGTPVLNRTNHKEKETLGMFISMVPVRLHIDNGTDFSSFVQYVSREWMSVLKHQKYSINLLLKDIRERQKGVERLYDIAISYQNAKVEKDDTMEKHEGRWHFSGCQTESLYIHINDREHDGNIVVDYDFQTDLYTVKEIEFIYDQITRLLWHSLDNPSRKLHEIEMVSEKEKRNILSEFNNTKAPYQKDKTVQQIFEEQVFKSPDSTAVLYCGEKLTYRQLNEKANRLARYLRKKGVTPDAVVGLMVYRSFEMIIGILGILKAGAAYLPIDPGFPPERIKYMLEDSNADLLLVTENTRERLDFKGEKIDISDDIINSESADNPPFINNSKDLAYIIYTSGSTGNPKGVMIEHYSVINRLTWMQKKYPIGPEDTILQKTPYTFDVSVWELMWWFFSGSKMVFLVPGGEKKPDIVLDTIKNYKITTMHFVPSMLNAFLDYIANTEEFEKLDSLKYVFASGEALSPKTAEKFNRYINKKCNALLYNLYGPTEATVDVSYYDCPTGEKIKVIPIGKPIDNIQLYILDKHMNVLPIGAAGELYISGDGLGRGYINKKELTDEKFIPNPFIPGQRMYKTGDLARWFPKGDVEYLGRIDHQVKIRGFRIELGEIQSLLLTHNSIKDALVTCNENSEGKKYLSAYIVFKNKLSVSEIKNYLLGKLPGYMVPSYFIEMENIPLSHNGKADLKGLPNPLISSMADQDMVEPRNDVEKRILEIWKKVLEADKLGVRDNFFDIGGDSLSAINAVSQIGNITIEDMYKYPTVELLASMLLNGGTGTDTVLVELMKEGPSCQTTIICFPYGGGNSYNYKDLADSLSAAEINCNLYSVRLPERGSGKGDEMSLDELAERVSREIQDNFEGELILYGHCVGSALALETARLLESRGRNLLGVCMGGIFPPKFSKYLGKSFDPWKVFSDKGVLSFLKRLGLRYTSTDNNELQDIIKAFRYDVRSFYKYFNGYSKLPKEKLKAPLYAIVGDNDLLTFNYRSRYKFWYTFTSRVLLYEIKNAKHYFLHSHPDELSTIIADIIDTTGGRCIEAD